MRRLSTFVDKFRWFAADTVNDPAVSIPEALNEPPAVRSMVPDPTLQAEIRRRLETADDKVSDLHLWSVGPGHAAVIASVVSDRPQDPATYKARLAGLAGLSHVTIEIHPCAGHPRASAAA